jgi:hypothetical protein
MDSPLALSLYAAFTSTIAALGTCFAIYNVRRDRAKLRIYFEPHPPMRTFRHALNSLLSSDDITETVWVFTARVVNQGRRPLVLDELRLHYYSPEEGSGWTTADYIIAGDELTSRRSSPPAPLKYVTLTEDAPTIYVLFMTPERLRARAVSIEVGDALGRSYRRHVSFALDVRLSMLSPLATRRLLKYDRIGTVLINHPNNGPTSHVLQAFGPPGHFRVVHKDHVRFVDGPHGASAKCDHPNATLR